MLMTRRDWLAVTAGGLGVGVRPLAAAVRTQSGTAQLEQRIVRVIREFEEQGDHRTATAVDRASADWLSDQVTQAGLVPVQESFSISRINLVSSALVTGDRRIDGLPLFDGAFTGAAGISGKFGTLGGDAEIGLAEAAPNTAAAGVLGEARRANRHQAIVLITRGGRPGLCPNNAADRIRPCRPW